MSGGRQLTYFITPDVQNAVRAALFYIMGDNDQQCGFGVFFSSTQAVTADRKFISEHQEGAKVHVKCQGPEDHLILTLVQRNEELGFALLECAHDHAYTETYQGDLQSLNYGDEDLVLAFGIEGNDSLSRPLAFTKASSVVLSGNDTHLFFACTIFAGNSCAAVVLKQDALVGVYLASVNALRERLQQLKSSGVELAAAEHPIGATLIQGPLQGHCALLSHAFSN